MIAQVQMVPVALPVVSFPPSAYVDIPYSPALLLDARFDASIVDSERFRDGCVSGFDTYFDELYVRVAGQEYAFVDRVSTWDEVEKMVVEWFLEEDEEGDVSLRWNAGFMLGWLSALALTDRVLALRGLDMLQVLVSYRRCEVARREQVVASYGSTGGCMSSRPEARERAV